MDRRLTPLTEAVVHEDGIRVGLQQAVKAVEALKITPNTTEVADWNTALIHAATAILALTAPVDAALGKLPGQKYPDAAPSPQVQEPREVFIEGYLAGHEDGVSNPLGHNGAVRWQMSRARSLVGSAPKRALAALGSPPAPEDRERCEKCGGEELQVHFTEQGDTNLVRMSSDPRRHNPPTGVKVHEHHFEATADVLRVHCKRCRWWWTRSPLDAALTAPMDATPKPLSELYPRNEPGKVLEKVELSPEMKAAMARAFPPHKSEFSGDSNDP